MATDAMTLTNVCLVIMIVMFRLNATTWLVIMNVVAYRHTEVMVSSVAMRLIAKSVIIMRNVLRLTHRKLVSVMRDFMVMVFNVFQIVVNAR